MCHIINQCEVLILFLFVDLVYLWFSNLLKDVRWKDPDVLATAEYLYATEQFKKKKKKEAQFRDWSSFL